MSVYDRALYAVPMIATLLNTAAATAGTVDLGIVAGTTQINGTVAECTTASCLSVAGVGVYTYNQLLFLGGSLNLLITSPNDPFASGPETVYQILADDLGAMNVGTASFNFPFTGGGASGTLAENSPPTVFSDPNDPGGAFTITSLSPISLAGLVGTEVNLNPLNPVNVWTALHNVGALGPPAYFANGTPTSTTTVIPLLLGSTGGTTYIGELNETVWQTSGGPPSSPGVPEPGAMWLAAAGLGAVFLGRRSQKR